MSEKKKLTTSEQNLAKIKKTLDELKTDQVRRDSLDNLPPEVVLRARELSKKGKFQRPVVKRTPKNFNWDTLHFDCGHTMRVLSGNTTTKWECDQCLEAWLLRRAKQAKKK